MMHSDNGGGDAGRIRPDDVLIKLEPVKEIMGDVSTSTIYDDPDLAALKIVITGAEGRTRAVRWIAREVHELRARRVAASEQRAARARVLVEERRERRRAKQRA
jgi:hypothetical protein